MTDDTEPSTPSTFCRRCSRHLTRPSSVKHGYGQVCYRKRMAGDPKTGRKEMDPCTIIDANLARKVLQAIRRLVDKLDENQQARGKCHLCGTTIHEMPIESFDVPGTGLVFPGYEHPQWFYLHDEHNDLALWKIGISNEMILDEMVHAGDLTQDERDELEDVAQGELEKQQVRDYEKSEEDKHFEEETESLEMEGNK